MAQAKTLLNSGINLLSTREKFVLKTLIELQTKVCKFVVSERYNAV